MLLATARQQAAATLSDGIIARHLIAVAELAARERDHTLSQHLVDVAYDLFGNNDAEPTDER